MARRAGVNIPTPNRVIVALQYVHGIGPANGESALASVSGIIDKNVIKYVGGGIENMHPIAASRMLASRK